jgi:hypothetical protein
MRAGHGETDPLNDTSSPAYDRSNPAYGKAIAGSGFSYVRHDRILVLVIYYCFLVADCVRRR